MFGRYTIVLAVAMLFVVGVCASALAQDADIAAIQEATEQYSLACANGDIELYMSVWDENGVQMPPDVPANIGKAQIRAGMEAAFELFDFEVPIDYPFEEAEVAGDWAFVRCTYAISTTPKGGGDTTTRSGKDLSIWKRQADGSWKLRIDCYNYNAPLPEAKVAGTSRAPGLAKPAQADDAEAIVTELYDRIKLAYATGDIDLYVEGVYAADGMQMPPDAPMVIGSDQMRAASQPLFDSFSMDVAIYPQEAVIAGEWGFDRCTATHSLTPKEGGATTTFYSNILEITKRQADGSWKIYIVCWNSYQPPTVTSVEATSWGQVKSLFE